MASNNILLSWIAAGIYNLDSRRFRKANLDRRREGWTETWGVNRNDTFYEEQTTGEVDLIIKNERLDDETISQLLSAPYPEVHITLTQFRPAWFEQMLLNVAGIPHIVLNSNHISNEATGQLPYLRDCTKSKPPVLVGRNHPSNIKKVENLMNNSILEYLQLYRNVNLDELAGLTTDLQRGLSKCFQYMINLELSTILINLRYTDSGAWEQIYREQYVAASNVELSQKPKPDSIKGDSWFMKFYGRFQASVERNIERKRLFGFGDYRQMNSTNQLLERANEAYTAIDRQLLCIIKENEETNSNKSYLLGTDKPALVDVLLWSHLAEALCDAHLVVLLSSYPHLMRYFQDMYQVYFSSIEEKPDEGRAWKDWNSQQNFHNAFQQIPGLSECDSAQYSNIKDAVDLMQKSSLRTKNLEEVLNTVKEMRTTLSYPKAREPKSFLLYRWCMGQTTEKDNKAKDVSQSNVQRKKLLRDQNRNDQMWISGIFGISAIAVLLMRGVSSLK